MNKCPNCDSTISVPPHDITSDFLYECTMCQTKWGSVAEAQEDAKEVILG